MEWISVKERLPPDVCTAYLVCIQKEIGPYPCRYLDVVMWYQGRFASQRQFVTHWMPLPDPPKETK
jgi:hypothetical protein